MKIHLVAFPHRLISTEQVCGFSAKAARFRDMMTARGHDIILYNDEIAFDGAEWDPNSKMWREYNAMLIEEIQWQDGIVCLATGQPHYGLVDALPEHYLVEYSIGYQGILRSSVHHIFESYAWMHWLLGKNGAQMMGNPSDTVICNFYPAEEFSIGTDSDYLLFVGRGVEDKGRALAVEVANRAHLPLITVGSGEWPYGSDNRGIVSVAERNKLMSNATAVLCPTLYIEPGCSVAHEALMTGTPVISTAWGVFPECVFTGFNGYLCRNTDQMVAAVTKSRSLDRSVIQADAQSRWSYDAAAPLFEEYFNSL